MSSEEELFDNMSENVEKAVDLNQEIGKKYFKGLGMSTIAMTLVLMLDSYLALFEERKRNRILVAIFTQVKKISG